MDENPMGGLARGALLLVGLVLLTSPLWKPSSDNGSDSPGEGSGGREAPEREIKPFRHEAALQRPMRQEPEVDAAILQQQLYRHARMERDGFYRRVVDNPEMPVEVRERFSRERDRLQTLATENPEVAAGIRESLPPSRLDAEGGFTPEFQEVVKNMQVYGVWDQMVEDHVEQMVQDANNPDLPEEERPTAEEIEQFRSQRLIPTL